MKAFVVGIGGGGDIVSAILAWHYYRLKGYDILLGCVTWERYIEDPVPGPICTSEFKNARTINSIITELSPDSYAIRNGIKVIPNLVKVLKVLNTNGYSVCIKESPKAIADGIEDFANKNSIDTIIGVDAGGDVLAKEFEPNLQSPLIDFMMLSSIVELKNRGFNTLLAVVGIGCDGELDQNYILKRISEIASLNGLLDIKGYDMDISPLMEEILKVSNTEASRIPFQAFKGLYGEVTLRKGTRKAFASPLSAIMFVLDPIIVAKTSKIYEIVKDAKNLEDANKKLNEYGVYTEYNFEIDIYKKFGMDAKNITKEQILKIKEEGKKLISLRRIG